MGSLYFRCTGIKRINNKAHQTTFAISLQAASTELKRPQKLLKFKCAEYTRGKS